MTVTTSFLEQNFESLTKILTAASKIGIFVGGTCVIVYSLNIGHFPQDLSIGDGLLFLMAAGCFGVIYVFFVASLVGLGIFFSPLTRTVAQIIIRMLTFFRKRKPKQIYEFAPFQWTSVLFALFALMLIYALGLRDSSVRWNLPLLSVALYFFYSIYRASGIKIRKINEIQDSIVHSNEKDDIFQFGSTENLRKAQLFSLSVMLLFPLVFGGVFSQLLDAAMRAAHVRVENATIYVKEPYSSLIPKSAATAIKNVPTTYTKFDGVLILFKGFGKTTVISFKDGNISRKLEIPNEQLIVESL